MCKTRMRRKGKRLQLVFKVSIKQVEGDLDCAAGVVRVFVN